MITAATLALEVLYTRLLSVLTWYSLAFFVIAMGLFGLTAGAVHVYLAAEHYTEERLASSLARACRQLALAIPLSYVLLLVMPLRAEPVATTIVLFVLFSLALALPFYPAGIVVAAAVTRTRFPVGRVYAVDLLGAALGAPLVPALLQATDGGTAILLIACAAALAAACFAASGEERGQVRRSLLVAAALIALTAANGATRRGLVPLWVKERAEVHDQLEAELWNSHSRVEVFRPFVGPALFWGLGTRCQAPMVEHRLLVIDGHAATPLYHARQSLEELRFIECDVTNVANLLRPGGSAAIIGVGGSRDIQAALLAGRAPVVGIELNDRMLQILRGPMGAPTLIQHHAAVRLVHDEARSYLARHPESYDLIQASLIDTWAATGAGAHALGENGLYTLEAWRLFVRRLTPNGIFSVSRWNSVETTRMVVLAVATLRSLGVEEPHRHLALLQAGLATTLVLSRSPLGPEDLGRLDQIAAEKGFEIVYAPHHPPKPEWLRRIFATRTLAALTRASIEPLLDYSPPTDERPFFFNVLRLRSFWHPLPQVTTGSLEGNRLATRTLGLAFLASLLLVAGAILVPLGRRARPRGRSGKTLYAGFAYFALIGIGFMLAEIALLQRLGLVLGHPIYSLIVVLSSLVASAGLGSLLSDRLPLDRAPLCYVYPLLIAGLLAAVALGWSRVAPALLPAPTPARIGFAIAVTSVLGLAMGTAFPAGLRLARASLGEETPWLWGLNGVGSVLASSAAILIALEGGLATLMLVAAACYALLLLPIGVLVRHAAPAGTAPDQPAAALPPSVTPLPFDQR